MPSYNSDRRSVLKIIGAIGATCAYPFAGDELFAATEQMQSAPPPVTVRHFFADGDFRTIARIADLIIPRTDTPGAIDAGAPAYIDLLVSRNEEHQMLFSDGLRWLDQEAERINGKPFMELAEEDQLSILEPLSAAASSREHQTGQPRNVQFFSVIKSLTADGYYTSKAGLIDELGYKGNMARGSFPDCVHEH